MRVTHLLIDPDRPPPLSQVAKLVGVSTGGLEYLHPEVCKEIKANYQRWRASELIRKRAEAMVEVLQYLESDAPSNSRKGALRAITARTSLPKNLLRGVIAAEFIKTGKPT